MKFFKSILLASLTCLTVNVTMANSDDTQAIEDFVNKLDDNCAYTDGYKCHQSDPNFYSEQAQQALVPAVYLSAWAVANEAFSNLTELDDVQKNLLHYKIGFAEQEDQIVVLFSPNFLPYFDNGKAEGVSTGVFGQSVKFWIDKKTLTVTKRLYLK